MDDRMRQRERELLMSDDPDARKNLLLLHQRIRDLTEDEEIELHVLNGNLKALVECGDKGLLAAYQEYVRRLHVARYPYFPGSTYYAVDLKYPIPARRKWLRIAQVRPDGKHSFVAAVAAQDMLYWNQETDRGWVHLSNKIWVEAPTGHIAGSRTRCVPQKDAIMSVFGGEISIEVVRRIAWRNNVRGPRWRGV